MGSEMCIRDRRSTGKDTLQWFFACVVYFLLASGSATSVVVITSLHTRSWTVQAAQSRILYKPFSRHTVGRYDIVSCAICNARCPLRLHILLHETRARTHTPLDASSTDSADRLFRFTRFAASFRSKASKICGDSTASKLEFLACLVSIA